MNVGAAVAAVCTLLESNKVTLVSGIAHQGVDREIKTVYKSILTPPLEYYSITVHCPEAPESLTRLANTSMQRPVNKYMIEMHVSDYAIPQSADSVQTPFETMHQDFRKLLSRIAALIRETKWLPTAASSPKYRVELPNARITVNDRTAWFSDRGGRHPIMYGVVRFALICECGDSGALY